MKQFFIIAALILLALPVKASENDSKPERRTKTFTVSKGGKLEMNVSGGDIHLSSWSKNEVTVVADGIDDDDMNDLTIAQEGQTIRVEFRPRWGSSHDVRFAVSLPAQFNVDVHTSGGDIAVDGTISGTLKGSTSGGDIRTASIEGPTTLKTSGGDITLGKINGRTEVRTSGGDIRIESVSNNLNAATSGGDVTVGDIGGEASLKTSGGDIRAGKVTGKAELKTSGGNIELAGASGSAEATTAGGNVVMRNITGSIIAKTAGGNLQAELNPSGGSRSELRTAAGNVTLTVPANAKATVEATIYLGRGGRHNRNDEFSIRSDFDGDSKGVEKRDDAIRAVYKINGGGELITVETSAGNIDIRKK